MKLARVAPLLALTALLLSPTARADGGTALDPFTAVVLQGSLSVRFVPGAAPSYRIVQPNASTIVTTRVSAGRLTLVAQGGGGPDTVVEITCPHLARLEITGSGDVEIRAFTGSTLNIKASGSGDLVATGTVETLTASILGSSDMDLRSLMAKHATVSILGSGDLRVQATDTLKVQILGSGDVTYSGSAQVTKQVLGTGDVKKGD